MAEKPNPTHVEDDDGEFYRRDALEGLELVPTYLKISEILLLRYEQFLSLLENFNQTLALFTANQANTVRFCIVAGSDGHMFWKFSVRIKCLRISRTDNKILQRTNYSLNQFLSVYRSITQQLMAFDTTSMKTFALQHFNGNGTATTECPSEDSTHSESEKNFCLICHNRPSTILLTCEHKFCDECFQRWAPQNSASSSESCPVCQINTDGIDDVVPLDIPDFETLKKILIETILALPDVDPAENVNDN